MRQAPPVAFQQPAGARSTSPGRPAKRRKVEAPPDARHTTLGSVAHCVRPTAGDDVPPAPSSPEPSGDSSPSHMMLADFGSSKTIVCYVSASGESVLAKNRKSGNTNSLHPGMCVPKRCASLDDPRIRTGHLPSDARDEDNVVFESVKNCLTDRADDEELIRKATEIDYVRGEVQHLDSDARPPRVRAILTTMRALGTDRYCRELLPDMPPTTDYAFAVPWDQIEVYDESRRFLERHARIKVHVYSESTMAALAASKDHTRGQALLVVDWGGKTVDLALLAVLKNGQATVKAANSLTRRDFYADLSLGGEYEKSMIERAKSDSWHHDMTDVDRFMASEGKTEAAATRRQLASGLKRRVQSEIEMVGDGAVRTCERQKGDITVGGFFLGRVGRSGLTHNAGNSLLRRSEQQPVFYDAHRRAHKSAAAARSVSRLNQLRQGSLQRVRRVDSFGSGIRPS